MGAGAYALRGNISLYFPYIHSGDVYARVVRHAFFFFFFFAIRPTHGPLSSRIIGSLLSLLRQKSRACIWTESSMELLLAFLSIFMHCFREGGVKRVWGVRAWHAS